MSIKIDVKVYGLEKALNNLDQYMERKKKGLMGVVSETATKIQNTAKELAPRDLGNLREGIVHTLSKNERKGSINGEVLSSMPYSAYVEFGTRPHRPPYKALEGWSKRHGIPTWAVVEKIAKKGTPPQPFMTPAAMIGKDTLVRGVINEMKLL